jgi:hypothetical protein
MQCPHTWKGCVSTRLHGVTSKKVLIYFFYLTSGCHNPIICLVRDKSMKPVPVMSNSDTLLGLWCQDPCFPYVHKKSFLTVK